MSAEIYVRLKIISQTLTPNEISSAIGMCFDRSWKIGDRRSKTVILEKNNGWIVESGLPKNSSLEAHIDALMKRLAPFVERINILANHNTVEFSCVIYSKEVPSLYFNRKTISDIYALGADFDIDFYKMNGHA